ncbi:MAG: sulfatase-like hydrolase/transferase [Methanosarcinaceae archaeon]|nr:sulfatase-like hydrolase/transferase [Methanosarcinaceae archaeon]
MNQKISHPTSTIIPLLILAAFLLISFFPTTAIASTIVEVNPVNTPDGAVILIIDGLGSPYIYPELIPHAIDKTALSKAVVYNISQIAQNSVRVVDIRAPQTYTEAGHSVLITGNSGADGEMVGYSGANIYDIAHDNGYLALAVLQKGDFYNMRAEQDIVVYDETNSINNPTIKISTSEHSGGNVPRNVVEAMEMRAVGAYDYVNRYPESSGERYDAYNRWAIDTGSDIIKSMSESAPEQKYILTINAGAIDSSGHYRRNGGYIENIEGIDAAILPLYELCIENNLAFIFTADHGMAFAADDVSGGHQAKKYAVTSEAQMIPFIVHTPNLKIEAEVISGKFGQEDIAPTILSILNIPNGLRFTDGSDIGLKDYVNINVDAPASSSVELVRDGVTIASASDDDEYLFVGLESGVNYTVRAGSALGAQNGIMEQEVLADSDIIIEFTAQTVTSGNGEVFQNMRHLIGGVLIVLINVIGLVVIVRIFKE